MSDLGNVRRFQYRHCRHKADFTVEFIVGAEIFIGICSDVSTEGIRASFDGGMVVGSRGLLILHKRTGVLKLEAQVAYVETTQVGLNFLPHRILERGKKVEFVFPTTNDRKNEEII